MNSDIYQRFLERLPKYEPFKICHLCILERGNLLQASQDSIRKFFEIHITKLKFPSGWQFVCNDCMRRLNETKDFLNILLDADAFWKTYLADSHHIKQPAVIDQAENVPNVGAIERQAVEVKIKRESSPQPEAVFLPCNSSEVGDNQFEVKEEIGYDSTGSTEVADFQDSFEANIEITNELEQSDANLVRKYNKKIKLVVRCEYCDKELLSTSAINTHTALHERSLNCAHCGMTFRTMPTIRLHLLTMHRHGPSVKEPFCALCELKFPSKESLRSHIKELHITDNQIKCPDCDKTYCNRKKLVWHIRTHIEKSFQCSVCPKICTTKITLKRHAAMHSDERPFMCELCGIRTKTKVSIRRHIIGVHEMKKQKNYKVRKPLKCPLCDEKYVKLSKMKLHLHESHAELARTAWKRYRSLCCVICYLKFDTADALEEHCRKFSGAHKRPLLSRRKHIRQYDTENLLYRNKVDRPFECNICKNTFKSQNSLSSHANNHSDKPRPFKCETCGATYTRSNDLRLHTRRAHTGERSVACTLCFYRCYTQHELNSHHVRVHTDTKLLESN